MRRALRMLAAVVLLVSSAACGGGGNGAALMVEALSVTGWEASKPPG
jgi:hypothetical protein